MIGPFEGEYRFLSNFYPDDGHTLEHEFQAAKTPFPAERARVLAAPTPKLAKRRGRQVTIHPQWDDIKIEVMRQLIRFKFEIPDLRLKLMATGSEELIEDNYWGDDFWGVYKGRGENWLGRLLMEERERIREEESWDE